MFIPTVTVPCRRGGKKPTRRQRMAGVMTSVIAVLVSAIIGAAFSTHSRADTVALTCIITLLAFVGGIVLARVIGARGKI